MMRLLSAAFLLAISSPGYAQETDHSMHGVMKSNQPMQRGHAHQDVTETTPIDHGIHGGHVMPSASETAIPPVDHSGHMMHDEHMNHGTTLSDPPKKPVDKRAYSGPAHAADFTYDPAIMARARGSMVREHGTMTFAKIMLDRLETKIADGHDGYAWEGDAWIGQDIDKLWIKSEGEGAFGETPEQVEIQALWSHAIGPWLDLQMGARHDFRPDPDRTHAVIGVQGLLPYWLEVNGALFLSQKGDVTARGEVEYDLRITPNLIVQPRIEMNFSAQKIPEIGVGAGVTNAEMGLRLRYHVTQQIAPYIGVQWENAFGATRRYLRRQDESPSQASLIIGLRIWF